MDEAKEFGSLRRVSERVKCLLLSREREHNVEERKKCAPRLDLHPLVDS